MITTDGPISIIITVPCAIIELLDATFFRWPSWVWNVVSIAITFVVVCQLAVICSHCTFYSPTFCIDSAFEELSHRDYVRMLRYFVWVLLNVAYTSAKLYYRGETDVAAMPLLVWSTWISIPRLLLTHLPMTIFNVCAVGFTPTLIVLSLGVFFCAGIFGVVSDHLLSRRRQALFSRWFDTTAYDSLGYYVHAAIWSWNFGASILTWEHGGWLGWLLFPAQGVCVIAMLQFATIYWLAFVEMAAERVVTYTPFALECAYQCKLVALEWALFLCFWLAEHVGRLAKCTHLCCSRLVARLTRCVRSLAGMLHALMRSPSQTSQTSEPPAGRSRRRQVPRPLDLQISSMQGPQPAPAAAPAIPANKQGRAKSPAALAPAAPVAASMRTRTMAQSAKCARPDKSHEKAAAARKASEKAAANSSAKRAAEEAKATAAADCKAGKARAREAEGTSPQEALKEAQERVKPSAEMKVLAATADAAEKAEVAAAVEAETARADATANAAAEVAAEVAAQADAAAKAQVEQAQRRAWEAAQAASAVAAAELVTAPIRGGRGGRGGREAAEALASASLKQADHALQQDVECVVCLDERRAMLFVPCGHLCVCTTCCESILESDAAQRLCPMCKTGITSSMRVYF